MSASKILATLTPGSTGSGSKKLSRIIRLVAACTVVGLVPCSAQTRREQRFRQNPAGGSGEQLIQSHLAPGHTIANAPNAELVEAICEAVKQSPARLTTIVDAVSGVRRRQRIELLCRAAQCASDAGSLNCDAIRDLILPWLRERPDQADRLLQRVVQCVPDCGEILRAQSGDGGSGHGGRRRATPPPGPPPPAAPPHTLIAGPPAPPPPDAPPPPAPPPPAPPPPTPKVRPSRPPGPPPPPVPTIARTPGPESPTPHASPEAKDAFPFPPPRASAFEEIPRELIVGDNPQPLLKDAAAALTLAFKSCGYGERSYHPVPNGFAMASRIEHMNEDGTPSDDRWALQITPVKTFSIESYLKALFRARPGFYRVIVFILTNQPFQQEEQSASSDQATGWVFGGQNTLPKEIGDQDYSDDYVCTALIYEFKRLGEGEATFVEPSEITGRTHLEKAGILAALAEPKQPEN